MARFAALMVEERWETQCFWGKTKTATSSPGNARF